MDFQSTGTVPERVAPVRNSQERGPVCRREIEMRSLCFVKCVLGLPNEHALIFLCNKLVFVISTAWLWS